jgi:dolichol-phosphate mannosyltransferase
VLVVLCVIQALAALVLLRRLVPGFHREPPVEPRPEGLAGTTVSVIVPTLNEASRLAPCLEGLGRQGAPLLEVLVVDSGSIDGTGDVVEAVARRDSRVRLETDPPLPPGWIGKVWALQHGLGKARGEWVLGVDADTEANEGMVAGVIAAADRHGLDLVSFSPMFAGQSAGERFVQPALLATLVYRFGPPSPRPTDGRILANGQCFLVKRSTLLAHGGYEAARGSFADDVALVSHLAGAGVRCGFLDGRLLYRVRAYRSLSEMWREWGRSVDLSDTVTSARRWADIVFLLLVQAAPAPLLAGVASGVIVGSPALLTTVNGLLLALRLGVHLALAPSYERRGPTWWLAWLADPVAVARIVLSAVFRPSQWRGRRYHTLG